MAPVSPAGGWPRPISQPTNLDSPPIWAEIQFTSWMIDGGILLIVLYVVCSIVTAMAQWNVAMLQRYPRLATCGAVVHEPEPRCGGVDFQLYAVQHADRPSILVSGRRSPWRRLASRHRGRMRPWLVASGDFTTLGGMDRANHGLAQYLARSGREVHLVAHRVAEDLERLPGVTVHAVPRPLGAHMFGAPLLAHATARRARALGGMACVLVQRWQRATPDGDLGALSPRRARSGRRRDRLRTLISSTLGRRYLPRRRNAPRWGTPPS